MKNYEFYNVDGLLRQALQTAAVIATKYGSKEIRTAHLLLGILSVEDSDLFITLEGEDIFLTSEGIVYDIVNDKKVFEKIFGKESADFFYNVNESQNSDLDTDIDEEKIEEEVAISIDLYGIGMIRVPIALTTLENTISLPYSNNLEKVFEITAKRCENSSQDYIDIDNITYALLEQEDSSAIRLLKLILEDEDYTISDIVKDFEEYSNIYYDSSLVTADSLPSNLSGFCEMFNTKFNENEESDILYRDKEIEAVWNILSKKTKKNVVLIGDPGVGKTAIVEAITQAIVNKTCPKRFLDYKVVSFDVNSAIAGTMYRGQFEERVNELKKFLKNNPKVILFIDEIHHVLGAGAVEGGGIDLSGALKPILSRDEVHVIGATTTAEYNGIMSRDGAFKRRFEVVEVEEPKIKDVPKMIANKVKGLESYHNVKVQKGFLDYIACYSSCFYDYNNCNPDKTLDLCDRCMSLAENMGDKVVTKKHFKLVYKENFEKLSKMSYSEKRDTAYHEAGHYILNYLTNMKKFKKVVAVSIVPTMQHLGVNFFEQSEDCFGLTFNKDNYLDEIAVDLAGRIAEELVSSNISDGASADLRHANEIARNMILKYGMDEDEYFNFSLGNDSKDNVLYSEKVTNDIIEKAKSIVDTQYKRAKKLLTGNRALLDKVANVLIEKSIVSGEELEKIIAG